MRITQSFLDHTQNQLDFDISTQTVTFSSSFSKVRARRKLTHCEQGYLYDLMNSEHAVYPTVPGKICNQKYHATRPNVGTLSLYVGKVLIAQYSAYERLICPSSLGMAKLFNFAAGSLLNWTKEDRILRHAFFPEEWEVNNPQSLIDLIPFDFTSTFTKEQPRIPVVAFDVTLAYDQKPLAMEFSLPCSIESYGSSNELKVTSLPNGIQVSVDLDESQLEKHMRYYCYALCKQTLYVFRITWNYTNLSDRSSRFSLPSYGSASIESLSKKKMRRNSMASSGYSQHVASSPDIGSNETIGYVRPIPGASAPITYSWFPRDIEKLKQNQNYIPSLLFVHGRAWMPISEQSFEIFI